MNGNTLWRMLAVVLVLLSGVLAALATPRPVAAQTAGLYNEKVAFKGRMYEAVNSGNQVWICRTEVSSPNCTWLDLGGLTYYHITLAANDSFLVVFARGDDNGLWSRTTFDGTNFTGWTNGGDGGVLIDNPAAFSSIRGGFVGATVSGTGGVRYFKYTTDGTNFSGWIANNAGLEIAMGSNALTPEGQYCPYSACFVGAFNNMRPEVVRVRMFLDNPNVVRFSVNYLDDMVNRGARVMIINGTDFIHDENEVYTMLTRNLGNGENLLTWSNRMAGRNVQVFFELGNEPDRVQATRNDGWAYDEYNTRFRALQILDWFNANLRGSYQNMRMMISLPTTQNLTYFNNFVDYSGDGRGRIGDRFDAVAIHTYSFGCFDYNHGNPEGQGSVIYPIDRAKQSSARPIYVTEGNVNTLGGFGGHGDQARESARWQFVGPVLVSALKYFDGENGRVKGFTPFQSDWSNYTEAYVNNYNLDFEASDFFAHRAIGNRQRSADCP